MDELGHAPIGAAPRCYLVRKGDASERRYRDAPHSNGAGKEKQDVTQKEFNASRLFAFIGVLMRGMDEDGIGDFLSGAFELRELRLKRFATIGTFRF